MEAEEVMVVYVIVVVVADAVGDVMIAAVVVTTAPDAVILLCYAISEGKKNGTKGQYRDLFGTISRPSLSSSPV